MTGEGRSQTFLALRQNPETTTQTHVFAKLFSLSAMHLKSSGLSGHETIFAGHPDLRQAPALLKHTKPRWLHKGAEEERRQRRKLSTIQRPYQAALRGGHSTG